MFTSSGAAFIFVAGKDLQERWAQDVSRGDSIYESVFAGNVYMPCLWEAPHELVERLIGPTSSDTDTTEQFLDKLKGFLHYQSRGIPRKALHEINNLVVWHEDGLRMSLKRIDLEKIDLFYLLDRVLCKYDQQIIGDLSKIHTPTMRKDENRLFAYYLTDLILSMGKRQFTVDTLIETVQQSIHERLTRIDDIKRITEALVVSLVKEDILRQVTPSFYTRSADVPATVKPPTYCLHKKILFRLQDLAEVLPGELEQAEPVQQPEFGIVHFEPVQLIATSHFNDIYKAIDRRDGQPVALKILKRSAPSPGKAMLLQEMRILKRIKHPGIVRMIDAEETDDDCYVATQFIEGEDLGKLLRIYPRGLELEHAVKLCQEICTILTFLHSTDIYRIDLKPSNIMITKLGGIKMVDFGTAVDKQAKNYQTWRTHRMGTRAYMAPELYEAPESADHRVDIYAFGVLFYELLTGNTGIVEDEGIGDTTSSAHHRFDLTKVDSVELSNIIEKCVRKNPNRRFQRMEEICPELANWQFYKQADTELQNIVSQAILEIKKAEQIEQKWTEASVAQLLRAGPDTVGTLPAEPILFQYKAAPQLDDLAAPLEGSAPLLRLIPSDDSDQAFMMPPAQRQAEIGRDLSNDLVIQDDKISRSHATLIRQGALVIVRNNGRLGTFVNGEQIVEKRLKDGDLVRFGNHEFRVELHQDYEDISFIQSSFIQSEATPTEQLTPDRVVVPGLPHLEDVDDTWQTPFDELFLALAERLQPQDITLEITETAKRFLCAPDNQARRGDRTPEQAFDELVEAVLIDKLLDNTFQAGDRIRVDQKFNNIVLEKVEGDVFSSVWLETQ